MIWYFRFCWFKRKLLLGKKTSSRPLIEISKRKSLISTLCWILILLLLKQSLFRFGLGGVKQKSTYPLIWCSTFGNTSQQVLNNKYPIESILFLRERERESESLRIYIFWEYLLSESKELFHLNSALITLLVYMILLTEWNWIFWRIEHFIKYPDLIQRFTLQK